MLKLNISPKSPRIKLSNDTFAERKCREVFAYESETFHRRRPNGISHRKNGAQNPQNDPFSLHDVGPSNTAMPLPTARTTPNRNSNGWGIVARRRRKAPLVTMARPKFAPKVPLPVDRSPNPTIFLIPGPDRPMMPNGILMRSAVFPQCTGQTDRPTDCPRESLTTIGRCAPRATRPNLLVLVAWLNTAQHNIATVYHHIVVNLVSWPKSADIGYLSLSQLSQRPFCDICGHASYVTGWIKLTTVQATHLLSIQPKHCMMYGKHGQEKRSAAASSESTNKHRPQRNRVSLGHL